MLYIGIDLGTSAVKLILMNEKGKIYNTVTKEYPLYFPKSGWSEQNPEDWFEKTVDGLKQLTEMYNKKEISGFKYPEEKITVG